MPKSRTVKPTLAEFNAIKTWLVSKGCKQTDLDTALGTAVSNRTRAQIATAIAAHLSKSKKKK